MHGKRTKAVEDEPFDDDREACSGTEEGVNVRKTKDDAEIDISGTRVLRPSKGSKKRGRQLFFGGILQQFLPAFNLFHGFYV